MSTDASDSSDSSKISNNSLEELQNEVERVLENNGFIYRDKLPEELEDEYTLILDSENNSLQDYVQDIDRVGLLDTPKGKEAYYLLEG